MLVLSRKKNESIIIDGKIEVKIIESEDGRVRIGIEAPKSVEIHRKEVFDLIMAENKAATTSKLKLTDLKGKTIGSTQKSEDNKKKSKMLLK